MALAQLVVALCLLALSLGNKIIFRQNDYYKKFFEEFHDFYVTSVTASLSQDIKADVTSNSVSKKSTHQNNTGQHREQTEEQHNRFARWVFNTPTEEFNALPFSPDEEQENVHLPLEFFVRRSPEKLIARAPPLDKVGGGLYTRELSDPDFEGLDSLRGEAFGINRRYASQHELLPYYNTLKDIRRKRSETQTISELNDKAMQVRRLDKIDRTGFNSGNLAGSFRSVKKKISGPGFNSWQKKYLDETDRSGFSGQKKRNFDEIDRSGFHSLGKRNFDEIDRAGFHSLGKRNFDEIDRAGFHSLGKRNFDEIDRAGFHSLGKKNFDEIDRAGFHHFRRRNFDEIDKSGFRDFGKRDFDEIDRSGFRDFGKRDFDEIDRSGFRDFGKRNFDEIDRSGFRDFGKRSPEQSDNKGLFRTSARESAETYKNENNELGKRNFDEIDRSGFRSFAKRSTSDEKPENST